MSQLLQERAGRGHHTLEITERLLTYIQITEIYREIYREITKIYKEMTQLRYTDY